MVHVKLPHFHHSMLMQLFYDVVAMCYTCRLTMGPKQFHKYFIYCNDHEKRDGACQDNIADASGAMYRKMGTVKGDAAFDMNPKVPLCDAVSALMKDTRSLKNRGNKDVMLFFDGRSCPMMQERLHHEFHTKQIMEKFLLSHYLFHTRMQRLVLIAQLKDAIEKGLTKADLH